jgi:putative serine protease PepD
MQQQPDSDTQTTTSAPPPPPEPPRPPTTPPRPPRSWLRPLLAVLIAVLLPVGGGVVGALVAARGEEPAATGPVLVPASTASSGEAGDVESVARSLLRVVVEVNVANGSGQGTGSGVVMRSDGYVLTNAHVVDGADSVTLTFSTGERLPARVVGTDAATDVAVLKVDRGGLAVATFADADDLRVGQRVIAVGSPFGLSGSVTTGIVSATDRVVTGGGDAQIVGAIQTDAAINPGNSGGALADAAGQVVGINTAIATGGGSGGNAGVGFAIPSGTALDVAGKLIAGKPVELPYLGVRGGQDVTGRPGDQSGLATRSGALIQQVESGSPAAEAGLRTGDLVIRAADRQINNWDALVSAIRRSAIGRPLQLRIIRDGREQAVTVTPVARPGS